MYQMIMFFLIVFGSIFAILTRKFLFDRLNGPESLMWVISIVLTGGCIGLYYTPGLLENLVSGCL